MSLRTWSLREGNTKQEKLEGGKRRGKRQVQESRSKMREEDVPTQSQKEVELGLIVLSFQEVIVISTQTIPIEVDDMIVDVQEFHSPQQECQKR